MIFSFFFLAHDVVGRDHMDVPWHDDPETKPQNRGLEIPRKCSFQYIASSYVLATAMRAFFSHAKPPKCWSFQPSSAQKITM